MKKLDVQLYIQHFYFLHGSERVYQKQVLQALTVKLVTEDNRDFNFEEFDGRYSSVHQWIDAAKTIPFMGGTKLVFVENMHDKFTLSKKDIAMEELKELLLDCPVLNARFSILFSSPFFEP